MFDESDPPSPTSALVTLAPLDPEWQQILHVSNQVVLYNPTSHAISVRTQSRSSPPAVLRRDRHCPYCHRPLADLQSEDGLDSDLELDADFDRHSRSRAANYFQLLEIANETASRPVTPNASGSTTCPPTSLDNGHHAQASTGSIRSTNASAGPNAFRPGNMAEGYFKAFFKEECRLGMGANGSVFLCQHVLDGNSLGHFAVKKIAVGQSHTYLFNILREVRLLETLHHPNIITYHHAWLETCQFSSFGPKVPTLHVLMQWAEGGSLDDLIDARLGRRAAVLPHVHPSGSTTPTDTGTPSPSPAPPLSRSARIKAFRAMQRASPAERERLRREMGLSEAGASERPIDLKAVHLFSAEEVRGLFGDVVAGLAFLHDKSILHLDLKPGNVLLTWDEGRLIPRAMLCDFGTSQDRLQSRTRSGNTGTLEYASPESLPSPSGKLMQVDSKADMWSVGMILHKLLFFRLPYRHASDGDAMVEGNGRETADMLEREVAAYSGFKSNATLVTAFESRRLPRAYLILLEGLLNRTTNLRPSSQRVMSAIREGKLDPLPTRRTSSRSSLIPVAARRIMNDMSVSAASPSSSSNVPVSSSQSETDADTDMGESPALQPLAFGGKHIDNLQLPLLGLPMPPDTSASSSSRIAGGVLGWPYGLSIAGRRVQLSIPRICTRTFKSAVLIAKVSNIVHVCPDSRLHPVMALVLFVLAMADTWYDELGLSLVLGLVHLVIVWLVGWSGRGCVPVFQNDRFRGLW